MEERRKAYSVKSLLVGAILGISVISGYQRLTNGEVITVQIKGKNFPVLKEDIKNKVLHNDLQKLAITDFVSTPEFKEYSKELDLSKDVEVIRSEVVEKMYINNIGIDEIKKKKLKAKSALIVKITDVDNGGNEISTMEKVIFEGDKDYPIYSSHKVGQLSELVKTDKGQCRFYIIKDSRVDNLLLTNLNAELELAMIRQELDTKLNDIIKTYN